MEIICINSKFSPEKLSFFKQFGVSLPEQDKIYNIRDIIRTLEGVGFLLEEIINPKVPINHPIHQSVTLVEPNFSEKRFRTLSGNIISKEEIRELLKQTTKQK